MTYNTLIGLKVLTIRGFNVNGKPVKKKEYEPVYILFDDSKTYIELREQDYYDYHDCSSSARHISICQDNVRWQQIFIDLKFYPEANEDSYY